MNRLGLFAGIAGVIVVAVVALVLALSGGDGADDTAVEATIAPETNAETVESEAVDESAAAGTMADYSAPDWTALPLTDVRTGESFTLADFAGKTVLVHGMATWCTTCHSAHENLRDNVVAQAGDDVVFVSLSVETGLADERLASYAADDGFDWTFAVVSPELLAELTREFGAAISTPPVRPHFIIGPDGTLSDMMRGQSSAESLLETLRTFGQA